MTHAVKLAKTAIFLAGIFALSGCAQTLYPSLPSLDNLSGNVLSPSEQKKAINDMTAQQKDHRSKAAEEIERRE